MARAMATRRRMPPESSDGTCQGVLQFHEASASRTRRSISSSDFFLHQPERDVFPHRHRVEQRALLKNHADAPPQLEQFLLHIWVMSSPACKFFRCPASAAHGKLENCALARSGDAKQRLGFAVRQLEGNAVEHTFSSNAMETFSNSIATGWSPFAAAGFSRGRVGSAWPTCNRKARDQLGDKEIDDQNQHRCSDHRLGGGPAHALRAAPRGHSVVATHGGDNEPEQHRLHQAR